jgi:polyhydroxybutyrate depolymerase
MAGLTGLSRLADREGFIAAYPQGVQNSWNHGRNDDEIAAQRLKVDDVAFLRAVVDAVASAYAIDPARVFVTGISNGGFMAFRLACEAADRFAAIAPVVATLGEEISKGCSPSRPVPVVMFNGADDPLVPYGGGSVHVGRQERGRIRSVDDTVAFWAKNNGCANELFSDEPDRDPGDGVTIVKRLQTGCTANADVLLYTMKGGGHAWPGGPQYLPIATVGRATKDIDATEIIWSFFKDHPRTR